MTFQALSCDKLNDRPGILIEDKIEWKSVCSVAELGEVVLELLSIVMLLWRVLLRDALFDVFGSFVCTVFDV